MQWLHIQHEYTHVKFLTLIMWNILYLSTCIFLCICPSTLYMKKTYTYIYMYIYIYMKVALNSFTRKRTSSPKKIRQTFANPTFIFSGTCWPRVLRRTWTCDILKFVPGVWSLVTFHSLAAALKHLRSALRCWSLLTFIGQFWHNKSPV